MIAILLADVLNSLEMIDTLYSHINILVILTLYYMMAIWPENSIEAVSDVEFAEDKWAYNEWNLCGRQMLL